MSSSPAPSATAFTSAMAFRTRSAAARPGMDSATRGLARSDHHPAVRLFADDRAADIRIDQHGAANREVFECIHGIERTSLARTHLLSRHTTLGHTPRVIA